MPDGLQLKSHALGFLGAVIGSAIGFLGFGWAYRQGFYALILPGGLLGLGCGLLAGHASTARGIVCGVAALALGLFTEWWHAPFTADGSLSYFLGHLGNLQPLTMVMLLVGCLIAYWLGKDAGLAVGGGAGPSRR